MSLRKLPVDRDSLNELVETLKNKVICKPTQISGNNSILHDLHGRVSSIADCVHETISENQEQVEKVARLFLRWMNDGTIVRVIGAGRARLAAAVPANRLAHGGARVFVQGDVIPMPHSINGGGIIAASASGKTEAVLRILREVKQDHYHISVVGIARHDAIDFRNYCDHFIGLRDNSSVPNPLSALADVGELCIAEVLDAIVVAAGKLGGFDDRRWRLGHENLGDSGPYDALSEGQLHYHKTLGDSGPYDALSEGQLHQHMAPRHGQE